MKIPTSLSIFLFWNILNIWHANGLPQVQDVNDLCDAGSKQYTGVAEIGKGKSIFFWTVESRKDPKNDPVIIWLTGGPGGSSMSAMLTENGPCLIDTGGESLRYNPFSWSNEATVIFVDQPAGVGFSQANDPDEQVSTLEQATDDFSKFAHVLFEHALPHFGSNKLHIAGESYGGRWVPAFTERLLLLQAVNSSLAIKNSIESMILVNAAVGALGGLTPSSYDFGCTPEGAAVQLGKGFNETACREIAHAVPACERAISLAEDADDILLSQEASTLCGNLIHKWVQNDSVNPYNYAQNCSEGMEKCLKSVFMAEKYLDSREVKSAIGLPNAKYKALNYELESRFERNGAVTQSVLRQMTTLLDIYRTRVLVMNGNYDSLVKTQGLFRIYQKLRWHGQAEFRSKRLEDWHIAKGGEQVRKGGQAVHTSQLWFVSVEEAGHMVPEDQPESAEYVLSKWLADDSTPGVLTEQLPKADL